MKHREAVPIVSFISSSMGIFMESNWKKWIIN